MEGDTKGNENREVIREITEEREVDSKEGNEEEEKEDIKEEEIREVMIRMKRGKASRIDIHGSMMVWRKGG